MNSKHELLTKQASPVMEFHPLHKSSSILQFFWGIVSQAVLLLLFTLGINENVEQIVGIHLWLSLIVCCVVHIGCNYIFYAKYAVPAYQLVYAEDTLNMTSANEDEDDNSNGEEADNYLNDMNHSGLLYVCRLFMAILFFASNAVSNLGFHLFCFVLENSNHSDYFCTRVQH